MGNFSYFTSLSVVCKYFHVSICFSCIFLSTTPLIYLPLFLSVNPLYRSIKRDSGGRRGFRGCGNSAAMKVEHEETKEKEDVFEVLVEDDDGEFVSQSMPLL